MLITVTTAYLPITIFYGLDRCYPNVMLYFCFPLLVLWTSWLFLQWWESYTHWSGPFQLFNDIPKWDWSNFYPFSVFFQSWNKAMVLPRVPRQPEDPLMWFIDAMGKKPLTVPLRNCFLFELPTLLILLSDQVRRSRQVRGDLKVLESVQFLTLQ